MARQHFWTECWQKFSTFNLSLMFIQSVNSNAVLKAWTDNIVRFHMNNIESSYWVVAVDRCLTLWSMQTRALVLFGKGTLSIQNNGTDGSRWQNVYPVLTKTALWLHLWCAPVVKLQWKSWEQFLDKRHSYLFVCCGSKEDVSFVSICFHPFTNMIWAGSPLIDFWIWKIVYEYTKIWTNYRLYRVLC